MDTRELLQERLRALPARVTVAQLAGATGRTVAYVRKFWVPRPDFPPTVGTGARGAKEFDRDPVADWCRTKDIGVQLRASEVGDERRDRVSTNEIAARLGLRNRSAVHHHIRSHPLGSATPYPPAGEDGLRDWQEVLAWHRGHEETPRSKPGPSPTVGLTARQQQVVALRDKARSEGRALTAAELAAELDIHPDSARRLLRQLEAASDETPS
ncbi:hypothetical protein ACXZ65_37960 [Streptomyces aculeolatus]